MLVYPGHPQCPPVNVPYVDAPGYWASFFEILGDWELPPSSTWLREGGEID